MNEIMTLQGKELEAFQALTGGGYTGLENVTQDMLSKPFLKIAQGLSKALDNRSDPKKELQPGKIAGLRPGMFYNILSGKVFGDSIRFIAVGFKYSYLYKGAGLGNFKGEYDRAGVEELVKNGILFLNENKLNWHDKADPNPKKTGKCFDAYTLYVLLPDFPEEGVMPFVISGFGIKYFRSWISKVSVQKPIVNGARLDPAIFHHCWKITPKEETNEEGTWYDIGNKKDGSGIEDLGDIYNSGQYNHILPTINAACAFAAELKQQKVNYGAAVEDTPDEGGETIQTGFEDSQNPYTTKKPEDIPF